ncbi:hypothetical protein, partial [Akkermansia sp.]|uniref:hypothetical protein n=1 Tax=Akkermansia sp. TaxID=1872421 RepID=UPI0025C644C5
LGDVNNRHLQPPPTAIPEPPAFPSLLETQSPDAYFQTGFWDAWGVWIILASILLAVAIAVIVLIRRKGRIPAAPLSPAETAIRDISMLRDAHPSLRQAAVEFSLILRKYLVGETKDPALYETQQEFNRRADALTALPSELQAPTRDLLDRMASLKYEPDTPENDSMVNELANATVQLINDIEADAHRTKEETDLVVKKSSSRFNQR